jgi:MFS family permease
MSAEADARRTILFVNWAHALDHFVLLIFPTAVIAIAAGLNRDYSSLISLSTGAFVAFGLFALPVGWAADRFGRRAVLATFFFGYGASCFLVALSANPWMLAISLFVLGAFSAIYHPIGSAMIVANAAKLGRELGINGIWGNMGSALSSGISAGLAGALGWRAAFYVPGVILIATGMAFLLLVKNHEEAPAKQTASHKFEGGRSHLAALLAVFALSLLAGGLTFNIVSIALPKIVDERLGLGLPLAATGWITTGVFFCGAASQILIGRLIDRVELTLLFAILSALQPIGLVLAASTTGVPMVLGLMLVASAIYGQIVVNDGMIGRFVPGEYRNRVYSIRFFVSFTVGGLAVPLISVLRGWGGFQLVLLVTGAIGLGILVCAVATWALTRGRLRATPAAAPG